MKDISNVRLTTETVWVNYATLTNRDDALRAAQQAHRVDGFPAAYVQEVSSTHYEIMVLEERVTEPGKLSTSFKKILETSQPSKTVQKDNYCQSCYRRNLTPSQIAYSSHGETYCVFCAH